MGLFTDTAPRLASNILSLAAGQTIMPAEGWYFFKPGRVVCVQRFDPVCQMWRWGGDDLAPNNMMFFDGNTVRLANPSGCVVAATVTTAGSGYTTAPTVTAAAGGAKLQAIVGGAVSTAATIANSGSGYVYPPVLWIEQPPSPGIQAAGYCTISNGTISAVTITQQGAGYLAAPNAVVLNDFRDTAGQNGQVTLSLTGSGTITGVICTDFGSPITSGTVPALTFGSGSAAATAIMDWGVTSVSITTPGAGYTNGAGATIWTGAGGYVTATPSYLGSESGVSFQRFRPAIIDVITNSSGGLSSSAIIDPGQYQSVPTASVEATAQSYSTLGVIALTMGGTVGNFFLSPAQQGQQ